MAQNRSLSFAKDIRPLFTDVDVDHMKGKGLDLSSYDDVKESADSILEVVTAGTMPPPGSGGARWTKEMCDTFSQWMAQGASP